MKRVLFVVVLLMAGVSLAAAKDAGLPFNVRYFGNVKKMIHENNVEGVVEMDRGLFAPHMYAVGILGNAEGEFTALDGEVWLNYGKDGISTTGSQIKKGGKASLLIAATVEKWQTIVVPNDMTENEVRVFLLEQAKKSGLNVKVPFPFLIEGKIRKVVWEVMNGADIEQAKKTNQLFFRKLVGYREEAPAVLLGFYPGEMRAELDHPGELWHVHVVFRDDNATGHVNAFCVTKGARLQLPVK